MRDSVRAKRPQADWKPLRQQRRRLEVTQAGLADAVGCDRVTLWRLEKNLVDPPFSLVRAIAQKLGTPIPDLYVPLS